ncbi:MAG: sn-glycerol-3-phosphate ABC transporter ATP-binding protein UgpC [Anaerolineaceae bacterium]|jgi:multiple sugar transport system ATP-binding protein|nr:sn-glycerol-3-phosphate ABC transporter ATP-binding protein UgpC [Anaerolineaceae bacterium]MDD4042226.1 sn-glycerol-3-phosphate ABC transporter ATP-binding protein UgpC [Anaerolineaceae bacterium]MDD4577980.1 sn-glycerol-3-phosphate ABC transporter ATP-binding protein UgpC [Anaerolineaceae bacterium]
MASVTYKNVWKKFGDVVAVQDLNLAIEDKEFLVLVGPSGCGKTTALRCLAGLEEITSGEVLIGNQVVNDVAPKDRDIAMVFQSYALYPHMSVYDNMAFGLKLRKLDKADIDRRVQESARTLGIEGLLKRKPKELSGGQRQRVAVGRAIVREPKVFLFDEPLSNLDAKLRVQTRAELSKLHQRLQTTFIYVTHDQTEAMTMATRIAVMNKGILQQLDTPQVLYDHPNNLFVAGFIGSPAMNFFNGKVVVEEGEMFVDMDTFRVKVPQHDMARYDSVVGKDIIFGIRPEDIHNPEFAPPGIIAEPVDVTVDVTELMGNEIFLYLVNGTHNFTARVDPRTQVHFGDKMQVAFNMDNFHIFDPSLDPENPPVVGAEPAA